jgi:hypothetical protein
MCCNQVAFLSKYTLSCATKMRMTSPNDIFLLIMSQLLWVMLFLMWISVWTGEMSAQPNYSVGVTKLLRQVESYWQAKDCSSVDLLQWTSRAVFQLKLTSQLSCLLCKLYKYSPAQLVRQIPNSGLANIIILLSVSNQHQFAELFALYCPIV